MTKSASKKTARLLRTTERFLPIVNKKTTEPFAVSAAKYHPALKKLAEK